MKINHRETSFLIDTGAVASCVSEQFAKSLKLKPQPSDQTIALIAANGSKIESLGVIDVELSIQGLTVPFTFFVLRSLSHKAILGNDFLQESGAVIDCAKHSITLYDGLVQAALSTARDRYFVLSWHMTLSFQWLQKPLLNYLCRFVLDIKPVCWKHLNQLRTGF